MGNYFQQNVRGQIDVFFPDPSKYDLTAPRPKHWALDKPKKSGEAPKTSQPNKSSAPTQYRKKRTQRVREGNSNESRTRRAQSQRKIKEEEETEKNFYRHAREGP